MAIQPGEAAWQFSPAGRAAGSGDPFSPVSHHLSLAVHSLRSQWWRPGWFDPRRVLASRFDRQNFQNETHQRRFLPDTFTADDQPGSATRRMDRMIDPRG